jgi:hypothetical protein
MTAAKKAVTMCCVSIGYREYLMPLDKGTKLVELLQSAFECEKRFEHRGYTYLVGDQPEGVGLEVVRPSQIQQPSPGRPPGPRALPAPQAPITLSSLKDS